MCGVCLGVPGSCGVSRGVRGVPSLDGVPVDRCGVSGTTTCCEERVLLDGVGASEEALESGRSGGVDISLFTVDSIKYYYNCLQII